MLVITFTVDVVFQSSAYLILFVYKTCVPVCVFQGFSPPILIFVQSKDRAKDLFHEMVYDGMNVDVIHADRTQAQVG